MSFAWSSQPAHESIARERTRTNAAVNARGRLLKSWLYWTQSSFVIITAALH